MNFNELFRNFLVASKKNLMNFLQTYYLPNSHMISYKFLKDILRTSYDILAELFRNFLGKT
jgi:hypothetical protein